MQTKPRLEASVQRLAVQIINRTTDGSVGYNDAVARLSATWGAFEAAGATAQDVERITMYIRWAKWEGFCDTSPLAV